MKSLSGTILVADDDTDIRDILKDSLISLGASVITAAHGRECLNLAEASVPELILLDIEMPVMNGLDVLKELRQRGSEIPVIVITAYGTIARAVQAMKQGAYDFITKPFDLDHVALTIGKALERERLKRGLERLSEEVGERYRLVGGESPRMRIAIDTARKAAASKSTALLLGESGTGKEIFARAIHNWSGRNDEPFVAINCVGLSKDLLESELFGHEKGAFTGATQRRIGRFELANGGTIFLDEVTELPIDTQVKLLRVLQEGEFERVGSSATIKVDVRVIAASNRDLEEVVANGNFRSDLFYRLNVFPLQAPPLRDRNGDIPLLVNLFLSKFGKKLGRQVRGVSQKAMESMTNYNWPGNVRELQNVVERAVVLAGGPIVDVDDSMIQSHGAIPNPAMDTLERMEREHILRVLAATHWVIHGQKGAAEILGINPSTLRSRMNKLGIKRPPT